MLNTDKQYQDFVDRHNLQDYYLHREYYPFGYHPTFKHKTRPDEPVLYYVEGGFLTEADFIQHIKATWQPASREGQDMYCQLDSYFK